MIITFADRKLHKYANKDSLAIQKMGANRAKLFKQRLGQLDAADNFTDLIHLPGHYHQLKDNRKDQWACNLDSPYRLIFAPAVDPIPKDKDGKQILKDINALVIIEVINYHKEG